MAFLRCVYIYIYIYIYMYIYIHSYYFFKSLCLSLSLYIYIYILTYFFHPYICMWMDSSVGITRMRNTVSFHLGFVEADTMWNHLKKSLLVG